MIMRKVIEGLESTGCVGVERDAVRGRAVDVFEGVDCRFIVLMRRGLLVGGKKGEDRSEVGAGARGQPVDGADNALIDFSTSFEVWVVRVWWSDGIDGHTRTPWSHVRDSIHSVDAKTMSRVLCECGLGKVDGEMFAASSPGKGSAEKVVDVPHKIDGTAFGKFGAEPFLFCGVVGKENEIVNIHANVDFGALGGGGRRRCWRWRGVGNVLERTDG